MAREIPFFTLADSLVVCEFGNAVVVLIDVEVISIMDSTSHEIVHLGDNIVRRVESASVGEVHDLLPFLSKFTGINGTVGPVWVHGVLRFDP